MYECIIIFEQTTLLSLPKVTIKNMISISQLLLPFKNQCKEN